MGAADRLARLDQMVGDSDQAGGANWAYQSLDGLVGPYTIRTTGRPVRIYFKADSYVDANTARTQWDAGTIIHLVIDGVRDDDYCAYHYFRAFTERNISRASIVCDVNYDLAPGEHTIGFEHRYLGTRSLIYGGKRSKVLIEEIY